MMRASLRRIAVVARAETTRTGGSFDRRTIAVLLALGLLGGLAWPLLEDRGLDFDRGLWRAAVAPDEPLGPALVESASFQVRVVDDPLAALERGEADLAVEGNRAYAPDTDKGRAALAELEQAAADRAYRVLLLERDSAAAFPLRVEVQYVPQARPSAGLPGAPSGPPFSAPGGDAPPSGEGSGGAGDAGAAPPPAPSDGGFALLPPERSVATPDTLAPPFPFRSLILAYVFLVPFNFIVQVYAGSVIAERLGRKGEALLASPARPWEIVAGKTLPYLALMIGAGGLLALAVGGGALTLLALVPLALIFLAMEFVAAMFARSFRELTFLTVFASVLLTIYAFLPAVFADVHPVALVSPITLVVMDLRGEIPTLAETLYATLPLTLAALGLFVLGVALYREEDLFHQKPVHAKALDALARHVRGVGSGFKLSVILIPAVFVAELLLVTFLFAWPVPVGLVGVLVAVALVEETFKGVPAYAAVRSGALAPRRALLFGALAGLGFFVAEKGFLLASLAGLMDVPAAAAVFGAAGAATLPWTSVALLLVGPLALHVATATMSAAGARHGRGAFALAFSAAVAVHVAYNLAVVRLVGGMPQ